MNRLFIADKNFSHEVPRSNANGYKSVVIPENMEIASPFEFQTNGDTLAMVPAEYVEGNAECYTMLCREFGLVGGGKGTRSKMSVIFCDDGWMFVTLYHGCLVMNLDDQLLMPMVGDDIEQPQVNNDSILWVNADKLLGYKCYIGDKGRWMYDYEFMFELGGDNVKNLGNFIFRHNEEEDLDISLGHIAMWEQTQVKRQEAHAAKRMMAAVWSGARSAGPMEFDEPEPDEEVPGEEEEDDDSGVDW